MGTELNYTPILTEGEYMQSKTRYLIYSQAYDGWLGRMADNITEDMFKSISFTTLEEAESWMKCIHAPLDIENYEIQTVKHTMEVDPVEHLSKVD